MITADIIRYERSLHYIGEEMELTKNILVDDGRKELQKDKFRVIEIHRWHLVLTNGLYQRSVRLTDIIMRKMRGLS